MSTFTVYCHGTGFNRIKGAEEDELVAWFHGHTDGVEAQLGGGAVRVGNYMINDGPGHSGNGLQQPQQVNPISGDRKVNLSLKKALFKGPSFADHAAGKTGGPRAFEKSALAHGVLSGEGWDENVIRTVNLIQDLKFDKGQAIDVVNLVGWSRGAVTCMRIANKMYEVFGSDVKCNIIAVDPVAGNDAGLSMADTQVLEANVERYVGILAMHEMRTTFKPQDWSRIRAPATTAIFLPMPGVHNAQVMVKTPPDAAMITRNLACGLLRDWGSPIGSTPFGHLSSALDMCIAYARLVLALSEHKSYESQTVKGRLGGSASLRRRDFAKHSKMDTYTRGGKESYWINEHHRACFAAAFPDVYEFIFESTGSGEIALTAQSRFGTFFKILRQAPALRHSLMAKGLLDAPSDTQYTAAVGAGRYTNQVRCAWPDGFPLHA
jgi:hypothetical protein